ncbi:MAG: flagellar hook capping FlgD N-terminal domain-containing protein [Mariprofundaceae bacterium]|nr:flagellar hook capping FlgD N-terminal domain-containing protein [Mariprofundaceae bacterium]
MLTATAPSLGPKPLSASGVQQDMGTKEVFLKMLVAQMENQDPLNPTDSSQMSAQLAQFNMVEQQMDTNKYLAQIAGSQNAATDSLDMASAAYLGRTVMLDQSQISYDGSNQNFAATIDSNADVVLVTIRDDLGTPIRSMSMSALAAGDHQFIWDGKDDAGNAVDIGTYNINIYAADAIAQPINAAIQRSGIVDAVRMTTSGVQLVVDGLPTSLANVTEVRM